MLLSLKQIREEIFKADPGIKIIRKRYHQADFPYIHYRQRCLIACDARGRLRGFDEPWDWNGTLKEVKEFVKLAKAQGGTEVVLTGGYDVAASIKDFSDGNYEPLDADWEVSVWQKD